MIGIMRSSTVRFYYPIAAVADTRQILETSR